MITELQFIGVGFMFGLLFIGLILLLIYFYRKTIMLYFIKKKISKAAEILKNIAVKDEAESQIEMIKQLKDNKLIDPLIVQKAKEKLRREDKNGNIQQETRTEAKPRTATATVEPKYSNAPKQRSIPFRTATFNKRTVNDAGKVKSDNN